MTITKNPSKQIYSVVMEYILSNADTANTYLFNGYAGHTVFKDKKQYGRHYRGAILLTGFDINYNWESRDANTYTTNFISNWCEEGDELIIAEDVAILDTPSKSNPRTFMQPAAGGIRFKRLNNNGDPEYGTCRSTDGLDG